MLKKVRIEIKGSLEVMAFSYIIRYKLMLQSLSSGIFNCILGRTQHWDSHYCHFSNETI